MRIIQLLTTISYGDAVGNDAIALYHTLQEKGFNTEIYAENIDKRIPPNMVKKVQKLKNLSKEDILIYHLSTGTELNYKVADFSARKIMIYHNVTPEKYFVNYNEQLRKLCHDGIEGMKYLADKMDYCLADSSYNKEQLVSAGYKCKIDVLPILIPFADYEKKPSEEVLERYSNDGYVNILFTGRIAPNKCQEDVIRAFYMYQKHYNAKSRLFLVGSHSGTERYVEQLKKYVKLLGVENVIFTGHIKFDEILAYYKLADVFLCMSEHEGFCVPLVEAMYFNIPIIAFDSSAIGETLGNSGLLIGEKKPLETAGLINYVLSNSKLKEVIIENQKQRLQDFAHNEIKEQFLTYMKGFVNEEGCNR